VLTTLLLIPLTMIRGVVAERRMLQRQVEESIAASLAGPQRIAGPVLVIPYWEREYVTKTDDRGREQRQVLDHPREAVFVADSLGYIGEVQVVPKYKGIYKALVYECDGDWRGEFIVPANLGLDGDPSRIIIGKAYLALGLADVRGLRASPDIQWNEQKLVAANGSRLDAIGEGVHAAIGTLEVDKPRNYRVTINLRIAGTSGIAFVPFGKTTKVQLTSPWAHPNFGGRFPPVSRQIDANGFIAKWQISHLASRNGALIKGNTAGDRNANQLESFAVTFIEPVSIYLQAERAVKYGVLFIAITFAAFFLFETLKELRIHPLQYAMVGLTLSIFFLLLVSLSEHIAFSLAYGIAASASVTLVGYYLCFVLRGWRRGAGFAIKLSLLFAVLYGLLQSEDNALMLGSLLLFAVLAAIMILTRRVDWYRTPVLKPEPPATD
jgi:inner membrane protein